MEVLLLIVAGTALGLVVNWLADWLPADHPQRKLIAANATCSSCSAAHRTDYWCALWHFLRHRRVCPECNLRPRLRPVLVILAAPALLVTLAHQTSGNMARFGSVALVGSIFLLITIIDLEHHLILVKVSAPSAALIGVAAGLTAGWPTTLLGGLVGFSMMLAVYAAGVLLFKGHGMGAGDVVLSGLVGLAIGADRVLLALVMAMFAGGAVAWMLLAWGVVRGQSIRSQRLPYGPFIVLGASVAYWLA